MVLLVLITCGYATPTQTNITINDAPISALAVSSTHLYCISGQEDNMRLTEYTTDLEPTRNLSLAKVLIDNEITMIYDERRNMLYIASGWTMATIDVNTFTVAYTGWGKSNFESGAAFTSDFENLYVVARNSSHQWGFNKFSLPDLNFIERNLLQSLTLCTQSNASYYYAQSFWCSGTGGVDVNSGYCYGAVYSGPKRNFRIYKIDLETWAAVENIHGFMMTTTNFNSETKLFATQDIRKNLIVEATNSDLARIDATLIQEYQEYETGIAASENYIFVTGRVWGDQNQGTIVRISQSTLDDQISYSMPTTICGEGEDMNPMVAFDDNTVFAYCSDWVSEFESINTLTKFSY